MTGIGWESDSLPEIGITIGINTPIYDSSSHRTKGAVVLRVGITSLVTGVKDLPTI
jgi:hypothetical protein